MALKKVTFSLPALKTLIDDKFSCVYCIENCHRSLCVLPANLENLKSCVNEHLNSKVTSSDPELQGIILSHKNVKIFDSVNFNDDGNYVIDYIADIVIFKPSIGSTLTGKVNKKSADHIGVLVHSFFNATIPRPRTENECPKTWPGGQLTIGQQVTFEVIKFSFHSKLPYIKGKLIDYEERWNEGFDSGIGDHNSTEEGNHDILNKDKKKKIMKKKKCLEMSYSEDQEETKDVSLLQTSINREDEQEETGELSLLQTSIRSHITDTTGPSDTLKAKGSKKSRRIDTFLIKNKIQSDCGLSNEPSPINNNRGSAKVNETLDCVDNYSVPEQSSDTKRTTSIRNEKKRKYVGIDKYFVNTNADSPNHSGEFCEEVQQNKKLKLSSKDESDLSLHVDIGDKEADRNSANDFGNVSGASNMESTINSLIDEEMSSLYPKEKKKKKKKKKDSFIDFS